MSYVTTTCPNPCTGAYELNFWCNGPCDIGHGSGAFECKCVLKDGVIAGIVIGCLAFIALVSTVSGILCYYKCKCCRRHQYNAFGSGGGTLADGAMTRGSAASSMAVTSGNTNAYAYTVDANGNHLQQPLMSPQQYPYPQQQQQQQFAGNTGFLGNLSRQLHNNTRPMSGQQFVEAQRQFSNNSPQHQLVQPQQIIYVQPNGTQQVVNTGPPQPYQHQQFASVGAGGQHPHQQFYAPQQQQQPPSAVVGMPIAYGGGNHPQQQQQQQGYSATAAAHSDSVHPAARYDNTNGGYYYAANDGDSSSSAAAVPTASVAAASDYDAAAKTAAPHQKGAAPLPPAAHSGSASNATAPATAAATSAAQSGSPATTAASLAVVATPTAGGEEEGAPEGQPAAAAGEGGDEEYTYKR